MQVCHGNIKMVHARFIIQSLNQYRAQTVYIDRKSNTNAVTLQLSLNTLINQ